MLNEGQTQALVDAMFADPGRASSSLAEALKASTDPRERLELAGALAYCKAVKGNLAVARGRFDRVVGDLDGRPPDVRMRWLANAGGFFLRAGDFPRAAALFGEADDLVVTWSSRASASALLESSLHLGFASLLDGDRARAEDLCLFAGHLVNRITERYDAHPHRQAVAALEAALQHPPTADDVPLTFWFADVAFEWPKLGAANG